MVSAQVRQSLLTATFLKGFSQKFLYKVLPPFLSAPLRPQDDETYQGVLPMAYNGLPYRDHKRAAVLDDKMGLWSTQPAHYPEIFCKSARAPSISLSGFQEHISFHPPLIFSSLFF